MIYNKQEYPKMVEKVFEVNEKIEDSRYFVITRIHRDDLDAAGFDASDIDDDTMKELAKRMENDYLEQLYWTSMEIIAEYMGIPKKGEREEE